MVRSFQQEKRRPLTPPAPTPLEAYQEPEGATTAPTMVWEDPDLEDEDEVGWMGEEPDYSGEDEPQEETDLYIDTTGRPTVEVPAFDEELDTLQQEMVDRFGRYPEPVENLFRYARLRQQTLALQIQSVEKNKDQVFIRFMDHSKVSAEKLLKLVTSNKRATFSPQGLLTLHVPKLAPDKLFDTIDRILDQISLQ